MFERKRAPINICLTSENCVSRFVDFHDPRVAKMFVCEADRQIAENLDAVAYLFSRELSSYHHLRKISRELAFACSLIVNSINSFPTISRAIAAGDLSGGLAVARFSLEGLVRGTAIVCSTDTEREEALYAYENGARDSLARRRAWHGQVGETDNLPRTIGKLFSNPLEENGDYSQSDLNGRFEKIENLPSKKSDERAERELRFLRCVAKINCIESDEEDFKRWIKDWHSLSSSFSHADAFSIHITNTMKMLNAENIEDRRQLFFDLMLLLINLFCDCVIRFTQELGRAEQAKFLIETKKKYLKPFKQFGCASPRD